MLYQLYLLVGTLCKRWYLPNVRHVCNSYLSKYLRNAFFIFTQFHRNDVLWFVRIGKILTKLDDRYCIPSDSTNTLHLFMPHLFELQCEADASMFGNITFNTSVAREFGSKLPPRQISHIVLVHCLAMLKRHCRRR